MSSRHLRRLQGEAVLGTSDLEKEEEQKMFSLNPFALLGEEEDVGNQDEASPTPPNTRAKGKKKKDTKRPAEKKKEKHIERQDKGQGDASANDTASERHVRLGINRELLNYENEEQSRFSSLKLKRAPHGSLKSTLIPPRPHFDQILRNNILDLSVTNCEEQLLRFVYGKRAAEAELEMVEAASSGHPEALLECLRKWPTHPGTLLLLSMVDRNSNRFGDALGRIDLVSRRGCWRAALEIGRLLVSLDAPEWKDPTGSLFLLDFFALQAKEYTWIAEELPRLYALIYSSQVFPQLLYSLALAKFHLNDDEAQFYLLQAIAHYPQLAADLIQGTPSDELGVLERLYHLRCYSQWRNPKSASWLSETVSLVSEELDVESLHPSVEQQLTICRHAYLSELERKWWSVPPGISVNYLQVWAFDPLPPVLLEAPEESSVFSWLADAFSRFFNIN